MKITVNIENLALICYNKIQKLTFFYKGDKQKCGLRITRQRNGHKKLLAEI